MNWPLLLGFLSFAWSSVGVLSWMVDKEETIVFVLLEFCGVAAASSWVDVIFEESATALLDQFLTKSI